MATVTNGVAAGSTTNAATYTTASFTPTSGDLLFAIFGVSGSTATDWAPSDSLSGSWEKILRAVKGGSADFVEVWVRTALSNGSALTVTFSHASGNASGCAWNVSRVAGMTRTGSSAIRGSGIQDNLASGATPAPTLSTAALTGNPTVTGVFSTVNGGLNTVPTNWTALSNGNHGTPNATVRQAYRNSGFTGTTITWGSTVAATHCSWAVEFDTSTLVERAVAASAATAVATAGEFWSVFERVIAAAVVAAVATVGQRDLLRSTAAAATAAAAVAGEVVPGTATHERSASATAATGAAVTGQRDHHRAAAASAATSVTTSGVRIVERSAAVTATAAATAAGQRDLHRQIAATATAGVSTIGQIEGGGVTIERSAALTATSSIETAGLRILERSAALAASGQVAAAGQLTAIRGSTVTAVGLIIVGHRRDLLRQSALAATATASVTGLVPVGFSYGAGGTWTYGPTEGWQYAGGTASTYHGGTTWTYGGSP